MERATSRFLLSFFSIALSIALAAPSATAATEATVQQVADFWDTVFKGAAPHGIPALSSSRSNQRTIGNATVWDVGFDSYRDPDTNTPVRIFGYLAVPNNITAPGPSGSYPGIVITHSVGGCPSCGSPTEGLETATYYAAKGYAALSFFLRGYPPSNMADSTLMNTSNVAFCSNMVDDGLEPFDTLWAGYPMDLYQAAEFLIAQPEVWAANGLSLFGHSLGGYAAVVGGIFSERYEVIATSAPPTTGSDIPAWMNTVNPISNCVRNLPGDETVNLSLAVRMVSFVGVYAGINSASLIAKDSTWALDNTEIFFYGGQQDTAVPAANVQASYLLADGSNNKAFHWSPTGGHGGPESFYRSEAWLAGHYPGISASPPTADIVVANVNGLTVDFSATASSDNAIMIAYDYDYGDGSTRNWGDTVTYSYGSAGTYTASVTVTDGEGLRDTAQVQVTVGGVAVIQFVVNATDPIVVDEGGNTTFTVNLSSAPTGTVNVTIARDSGDTDLAISGSATLGFSDLNWNNPHTVTIAAAQDADTVSGTAVFSVRASGLPTFLLDVRENDDDAPFTLTVGNASAMPGQSVDIPLTLSNPDAALIRSVSVTLSYDEVALGVPTFTRGIGIPGPAWWNFSATYPAAGTQIIAGNEIAQPDGVAVDDVIAIDTFAVPGATSPGIYDIIVTASDIDGRPATQIVAGTLTVSNPADGGATSDGGPIGGDSVSPADADVMPGDLNQVADTDVSGTGDTIGGGNSENASPDAAGCDCRSSENPFNGLLLIGALFFATKRRRSTKRTVYRP